MQSSIFHKLSNVLWVLIVILVVLLAVYVSVGRLAMSSLGGYQGQILRELNARLPFTIEAERVSGDWQSFTPIVVMSGLRLNMPGAEQPLELSEGRISVDVFHSLLTSALQMTSLRLEGLTLRGELDADGRFRLLGFDGGGSPLGAWLREFLLNIENITLDQAVVLLDLPEGNKRSLDLGLEMIREGSRRQVAADLVTDRGTQIRALAEGVGNPFKPSAFSGDLYLDIGSSDMGAVQDVPPLDSLPVRAEGAIALEVWLGWDKGVPDLTGRLEVSDLLLSDTARSWQLPLQRVAMEATLVERKNRWTLFGSNVLVQQDGTELKLPRLQVDAWGQALRVRTAQLPLAPLNSLLLGVDEVPAALADVFAVLQPRGEFSALQFSLGNYGEPGGDWELDGNFEQLEVEPWRGAPGARSASGYLELAPGGGFVVVDSRQFALEFPKVYSSALVFDDIYGTVNLDWDADNLLLSSGALTASGEEGVATALFSLNIPLRKTDVGLEMDLLVGLSDTDPIHRDKFLPYILNDSLLQWLDSSIGEGRIDQGGFLWRGSLPPVSSDKRTIQLFFNVTDTDLQFDPAWPSLSGVDSIVLIDDTNVSVWAERASMFALNSAWISAEARMDERGKMVLAVDGKIRGPAEDGLSLLNDSPIGALLGNGFDQWSLSGELEAQLSLQLNLAAGQLEPSVTVRTTWHDVDVGIEPGNLLVQAVNGELSYSTDEGLAAPALTGTLWGQALQASIGQRHRGAYKPGTSTVQVQLEGLVDMASVQRWLDLEALAFARGTAAVAGRVDITPGSAPVINLASDLAGVSLDLPEPWDKQANERAQLDLSLPLGGDSSVLQMRIDDQVGLNLEIADGGLQGGMLAFHEPAPVPQPGVLGVRGKLVALDVGQWVAFVEEYFADAMKSLVPDAPLDSVPGAGVKPPEGGFGGSTDPLAAIAPAGLAVASESETGAARNVRPPMELMGEGQGLVLQIDAMQVDSLGLYGQQLEDVEFSLSVAGPRWRVAATTDWLRGELLLERAEGISSLDIAYLDLHGLKQLQLEGGDSESSLELPAMDVRLREIWQGERLLGNLDFQLRSEEKLLTANNISGEIAAMRLLPERPGQLSWRQGEEAGTAVNASLQLGDLGETLRLLGYQQILETKQGSMELNLEWPGAPQDFSIARGSGSLRIDLGSGSFLEAPRGASGALRVVSVLNLADIVSRLSLSHMFESGIPFDSVAGEVFLHEGTIEVAGMDVQGSSSFRFSGVSDVAQRSLDGELVATLPVANNLPWVAALAGGLPVAAGVFVVSKVFEKQFNRLTSAVYSVDGSWDDPQVNFARIFDDEGLTGAGAEQAATSVDAGRRAEPGDALEGAPLTLEPIELPGEPGEPEADQSESL